MFRFTSALALVALTACKPTVADIKVPEGDSSLETFKTCDELKGYLVDVATEDIVSSRYGLWWGWMGEDDVAVDESADTDGGSSPTDYTTTNVQEQGVDEVDIVKTDGEYIYVADQQALSIVKSWPADDSELVSRIEVDGWIHGLFLQDDRVVVFETVYSDGTDKVFRNYGGTRMTVFDVTDRANPKKARIVEVDAYYRSARMIDGKIFMVANTWMHTPSEVWELAWNEELGLPPVPEWEASDRDREIAANIARTRLRPMVAARMASMDLDELLPLYRDQGYGDFVAPVERLHDCSDMYRPKDVSRGGVLSVLAFDIEDDSDDVDATGVISDGYIVYASQDNLYVAQSSWWGWWGFGDLERKSAIHKFKLDADNPTYEASGGVNGWIYDQFSMSEHDGFLRVTTTDDDWWWGTAEADEGAVDLPGNNVYVLDQAGGELVAVGGIEGIAPGERIYSTRMNGDTGYMVTFRQVDPLFTLDLSDPYNPRVLGELHIPGYSAYLHPVGTDHLLAVGMAGDWDGNLEGVAVNVFDVSDLTNPRLADQYVFQGDGWGWSEALWDHHAFTYHRGVLSIPGYTHTYNDNTGDYEYFSGLLVLDVDLEDKDGDHLTELGRIDHSDLVKQSNCMWDWGCDDYDYWYADVRRSIYIEDNVYSVSNYGIKVNDLNQPDDEHTRVLFDPR